MLCTKNRVLSTFLALLALAGCRQNGPQQAPEPAEDVGPASVPACPKVGDALDLPDSTWTVKLISFRFFRDIGTDANIVQAGPGRVFALAEFEWSARGEPSTIVPAPSRPPALALWDARGTLHAQSQDALGAFFRMQPGARFGVRVGGPMDRFLDAQVFLLPPEAARYGLWLGPEGPVPPTETSRRFCLGPYDVR